MKIPWHKIQSAVETVQAGTASKIDGAKNPAEAPFKVYEVSGGTIRVDIHNTKGQ